MLKRIIGLPGDVTRMTNGLLYVNGQELQQPFSYVRGTWTTEAGIIPPDSYLLIGDNRGLPMQVYLIANRADIIARVE